MILMESFETRPATLQKRPQAMSPLHSFNILSVSAGLNCTQNVILFSQRNGVKLIYFYVPFFRSHRENWVVHAYVYVYNISMRLCLMGVCFFFLYKCVCTHNRQQHRRLQSKEGKREGLEERKAGKCTKSKASLFYRFNAKTVTIATRQSHCKRLSRPLLLCSPTRYTGTH